ncbi:MAG: hypothetical protein PHU61_02050 [Candidatus Absconditabacteria bacterium]|nr:hypothetical protein [Candidatus Absconditabacteria bacterium]MDD4713933.1 hypothetical protein [Candidatus Absconditabacteria bacterium]
MYKKSNKKYLSFFVLLDIVGTVYFVIIPIMGKSKKIKIKEKNEYDLILNDKISDVKILRDTEKHIESQIDSQSEEFKEKYYNELKPEAIELCEYAFKKIRLELRMNENIWDFRAIKTENKEIQTKYDDYTVALYEIKQFNEKIKDNIIKYGDPNIDFYLDHHINFEGNLVRLGNLNYYITSKLANIYGDKKTLYKWYTEGEDIDFIDEFFIVEMLKSLLIKDYENKVKYSNYSSNLSKILFQVSEYNPIQNLINYLILKLFGDDLDIKNNKKEKLIKLFGGIISKKEKMVIDNLSVLEEVAKNMPDIKSERLDKQNVLKLILRDTFEKHSREPFKVKILNAIECYQHRGSVSIYLDREKLQIGLSSDNEWIQIHQKTHIFEDFYCFIGDVFGQYFYQFSPEYCGGPIEEDTKKGGIKGSGIEELKIKPQIQKLSDEEVKKQAKKMMIQEITKLIEAVDYKNLTITMVGLTENVNIHKLKSNAKPGMVGAQYDDFGKKIGTGVSLKRDLKGYVKKIKNPSKKKGKE